MKTRLLIIIGIATLSVLQFNDADGHSIANLDYPSFVQLESFSTEEAHVGDEITITGKIQNRFDDDIFIFPDVVISHGDGSFYNYSPDVLSNELYFIVNSTISNSTILRSNQVVDFQISLIALQSGTYHIHSSTNPNSLSSHHVMDLGPNFIGPGKTIVIHDKNNFQHNLLEHNTIDSPLKQIKSGIALFDVQCGEEKHLVYKYDRMRAACVNGETETELINRGWALMRLGFPEYTRADFFSSLCDNYDGKWHPEHNGCRGDISDLQCSLMGGEFIDNLKICYHDICPETKTYTLCVTNSNEQTPKPPAASTQCKPGIPPFTSDFYLDRELCKWKLIPEPIIDEAILYVWNAYLQKRQIDFLPKEISYENTMEGWDDEKENKVCSPLILSDGTELYISSTFTIEPFELIDTVMSEIHPDDCHKIWKTDVLLVEPSPELGAWLKNYWEKENENRLAVINYQYDAPRSALIYSA